MHSKVRASAIAGLILAAALVGGCTVKPMLATTAGTHGEQGSALPSVSVAEVDTRFAQEVRNHLIFLLNGGAGQPANPAYRLNLNVTRQVLSAVQVQSSNNVHEPTAGSVLMTGQYTLVDAATGNTVAAGSQQATASFDRPQQEFAVLRAERDAENRAARELAEFIRLSLAQDFARIGGQ